MKELTPEDHEAINHITSTIETLRATAGLSVSALAIEADLSENTLKYVFKKVHYPSVFVLARLCKYFEIPLWEFFLIAEGRDLYGQQEKREMLEAFEILSPKHKDILLYIAKALSR